MCLEESKGVTMKRFVLLILGIILFAFSGKEAKADDSADYIFNSGYYWKNGTAYNRSLQWYKEYYTAYSYYCGYNYPYQTYYWKSYYTYSPVKIDVHAEDAETQLIRLAAARDKGILQIAERNQKSQATMALADKLGLAGNFNIPNYGAGIFPVAGNFYTGHGYSSAQLSSAGVNGNTAYGYSYNQVRDAYGVTDMNALYQQASRLTQNAQQLAGQANTDFSGLVGQAGTNQARVAEYIAKGQSAAIVLQAANLPPSTRTETRIFQIGSAKSCGMPNQPAPDQPVPDQQQGFIQPKNFLQLAGPQTCVQCHSGQKIEGGFDITQYNANDPKMRDRVLSRILSDDPKKRMPKDGEKLSSDKILHFLGIIAQPAKEPEPVPDPR